MAEFLHPGEELNVCPCGPSGSQGGLKVVLVDGPRKKTITQSRRGDLGRLKQLSLQKFHNMGRGQGRA
ncbi:hypothetical protein HN958_04020 [Candidatus Falkowbacteria bacterium]|nr:hypothetical protein [Candidatus Falkowbacteria bacterium]MBT7007643.1 hypothetical protein [Candidatus Falkowbacteria bacterium]